MQLLDDDPRRVEQRDYARIVPKCVDGGIHSVAGLDPEHSLLAARTLVAAYIDGARDLLEVRASRGSESRRHCILGQDGPAQRREASGRGSCRVRGLCSVVMGGNVDAKVCDDVVGCPATVARLERREGLDLAWGIRDGGAFELCGGGFPTFGFFLNMMGDLLLTVQL